MDLFVNAVIKGTCEINGNLTANQNTALNGNVTIGTTTQSKNLVVNGKIESDIQKISKMGQLELGSSNDRKKLICGEIKGDDIEIHEKDGFSLESGASSKIKVKTGEITDLEIQPNGTLTIKGSINIVT